LWDLKYLNVFLWLKSSSSFVLAAFGGALIAHHFSYPLVLVAGAGSSIIIIIISVICFAPLGKAKAELKTESAASAPASG
jgi:hypothetical protein